MTHFIRSPDFANLPPSLLALFEQAAVSDGFFSHPGWYSVFSDFALAPNSETRLYLDDLAAPAVAIPLVVRPGKERMMESLANCYSCRHDLLCRTPAPEASVTALVEKIASERPQWDRLMFHALDPLQSYFAPLASALSRCGYSVETYCQFGTWYENTAGMSFRDFLARRPSQLRNIYKRKLAGIERQASLAFKLYHIGAGLEEAISDYEAIYRQSWKQPEPHPLFVANLARFCARLGALRLGILSVDGRPAAAQLWIVWRGEATIFKLAHDQVWDRFSIGTLLTMRMMERVLDDDRPQRVDFGRGDDAYKRLWLPHRTERWGIIAVNWRTPRGFVAALRQRAGAARRFMTRRSQD